VLYCAKKAGVTFILKAGGAQVVVTFISGATLNTISFFIYILLSDFQAVAAMAWGTESCPKV
jgi:histidinol dehydrogenase